MEITTYTLEGCSSCSHVKELFLRANVSYTEVVVRKDMTVEDFHQIHPGVTHFPYVVIDGEPIGGLVETAKLFVQKGLVSSKKE